MWSWSLSLRLVYPVFHIPPGYDRRFSTYWLSGFGLISDGWLGSISRLGDWANALECWRSPSLRLVIPGIAVSPGVTHSDSHHLWHGTVVKPQHPSIQCFSIWFDWEVILVYDFTLHLHYITLRHFIRQLHLQWPMVHQQSHLSSPNASLY